jgi:hypothetical protein
LGDVGSQSDAVLKVSGGAADAASLDQAIKTLKAPKVEPETEPRPEPQTSPKAGLPALIPQSPRLVAQSKLDDALAWMNSRHAILDNVGGKAVISCWEQSEDGYERLAFQGPDSFRLRYSNANVFIDAPDGHGGVQKTKMGLALWWLNHRDRAQYRGVKFRPNQGGVVDGYLNLWRDWGVEARPGDWSLILAVC